METENTMLIAVCDMQPKDQINFPYESVIVGRAPIPYTCLDRETGLMKTGASVRLTDRTFIVAPDTALYNVTRR